MKWQDFCKLCSFVKAPLSQSLTDHLFYNGRAENQKALLDFLSATLSSRDMAKIWGVSTSHVSRLKSAKAYVNLEDVLKIIDASAYDLEDFLCSLTPLNIPPSLAKNYLNRQEQRRMHWEKPWVAALILFINTEGYRQLPVHSDTWFAERLWIPEKEVAQAFEDLLRLGVLDRAKGKFVIQNTHLNTGGSREGARKIRRFWLEQALERMWKISDGRRMYYGYKVFSMDEGAKKKAQELVFELYSRLDEICKAETTGPVDEVGVFSAQLFSLEKAP